MEETHKVYYVLDENKKEITVKDAEKGKTYICPICGDEIKLICGEINIWHFRHQNLSNGKSKVHEYGQQCLQLLLTNPDINISIQKKCCNDIIKIERENICEVELEHNTKHNEENIKCDVATLDENGNVIHIFEIYYTHKTEEIKRPEPWFEIDAREFQESFDTNDITFNCIRNGKCIKCKNKKSNIRLVQRGAGSGKTYEITEYTSGKNQDELYNKKLYIYITKMGSGIKAINDEIIKRDEEGKYEKKYKKCIPHPDNKPNIKKYEIIDQNNKEKIVLILTIDKLFHNLLRKEQRESIKCDIFNEIAKKVSNINLEEINIPNYIRKLQKKPWDTALIFDESQDVPLDYIEGIKNLAKLFNGLEIILCGDKLQSLFFSNNVFTQPEFFWIEEYFNFTPDTPSNKFRRSKNKNSCVDINNLIDFNKYNLPLMSMADENIKNDQVYPDYSERLEYKDFYEHDEDEREKAEEYIDNVVIQNMKKIETDNNIKTEPKDFMIIIPFVSNNFSGFLQQKINQYWADKYKEVNDMKYAVLHKSEEGKSIDFSLSEKSTQILSIHASKGLGRPYVFALLLSESSLSYYSLLGEKNITYYSFAHVALTRAKNKLFYSIKEGTLEKNDEYQNIKNNDNYTSVTFENIFDYFKNQWLENKEDNNCNITKFINKFCKPKENIFKSLEEPYIIDSQHHLLRWKICEYNIKKEIFNYYTNKNSLYEQTLFLDTKQFISDIKSPYIEIKNLKEHIKDLKKFSKINSDNIDIHHGKKGRKTAIEFVSIPVYSEDEKTESRKIANIFRQTAKNVIEKMKHHVLRINPQQFYYSLNLCPLEILSFLTVLDISNTTYLKDKNINISDVYDIFDNFNRHSNYHIKFHKDNYDCNCHKLLENKKNITDEKEIEKRNKYFDHYRDDISNQVKKCFEYIKNIEDNYSRFKWKQNKHYKSKNDSFELKSRIKFAFIGERKSKNDDNKEYISHVMTFSLISNLSNYSEEVLKINCQQLFLKIYYLCESGYCPNITTFIISPKLKDDEPIIIEDQVLENKDIYIFLYKWVFNGYKKNHESLAKQIMENNNFKKNLEEISVHLKNLKENKKFFPRHIQKTITQIQNRWMKNIDKNFSIENILEEFLNSFREEFSELQKIISLEKLQEIIF
jgi:hypothetical protein